MDCITIIFLFLYMTLSVELRIKLPCSIKSGIILTRLISNGESISYLSVNTMYVLMVCLDIFVLVYMCSWVLVDL